MHMHYEYWYEFEYEYAGRVLVVTLTVRMAPRTQCPRNVESGLIPLLPSMRHLPIEETWVTTDRTPTTIAPLPPQVSCPQSTFPRSSSTTQFTAAVLLECIMTPSSPSATLPNITPTASGSDGLYQYIVLLPPEIIIARRNQYPRANGLSHGLVHPHRSRPDPDPTEVRHCAPPKQDLLCMELPGNKILRRSSPLKRH